MMPNINMEETYVDYIGSIRKRYSTVERLNGKVCIIDHTAPESKKWLLYYRYTDELFNRMEDWCEQHFNVWPIRWSFLNGGFNDRYFCFSREKDAMLFKLKFSEYITETKLRID